MPNDIEFLVRFGRIDGTVTKTVFERSRTQALHIANSLSFLFWHEHRFKAGEFKGPTIRFSDEVFWLELKSQPVRERWQNGNT